MKKIISILLGFILVINMLSLSAFAATGDSEEYQPDSYPYTSYSYNAARAVQYAHVFYEAYNTYFYYTHNDCTNFVSQCVAYGFGTGTLYQNASAYRMHNNNNASTGWFAGSGGGSSPWESTEAHWTYMRKVKTNQNGPTTLVVSQSSLQVGDVMQVDFENDGIYDHSAICVTTNPLTFAQHTKDRDYHPITAYEGAKRFYRPTTFRVY